MFNKPAKFEKQMSRGAISVANDVNHVESPTAVISRSKVEEVESVNDGEYEKVKEMIWMKSMQRVFFRQLIFYAIQFLAPKAMR